MGSIKWKMALLYMMLVVTVMLSCGVFILVTLRSSAYQNIYRDCEYTAERIVDVLELDENASAKGPAEAFGEVVSVFLLETVNSDAATESAKSIYLLDETGSLLYASSGTLSDADLSSRAIITALSGTAMTDIYVHKTYDDSETVADYAMPFTYTPDGNQYIIFIRQPMQAEQRSLTSITRAIFSITFAGILIAGIMGYVLAASISRPIQKLTQKTQDLAAGNLKAASSAEYATQKTPANDELGQLEVHFDEMAHELSTSIIELQEMEQMQKDFVANVSHELRTPITTIKSYVETILDSDLEDKDMTRSFLTVVDSEADRMTNLISDLLELSRMDSHQAHLTIKPLDLGELLWRDLSEMQFTAGQRHQTVGWAPDVPVQPDPEVGERLPHATRTYMVDGDSRRLDQVLRNLLTNAVKYTPEGGAVTGGVYDTGEEIRLKVQDNGIGISKEDCEHIFDRFYRVDKARSRALGGTGLGLAIAKDMTELHGGHIWVDSEPGKGSTFWIALPKSKEESDEEA